MTYAKVIYDTGAEILLPICTSHNFALRGPFWMIFNAVYSKLCALSLGLGPKAVGARCSRTSG